MFLADQQISALDTVPGCQHRLQYLDQQLQDLHTQIAAQIEKVEQADETYRLLERQD